MTSALIEEKKEENDKFNDRRLSVIKVVDTEA